MIEALFKGKLHFTKLGFTSGELLLFSYLHQMAIVQPANMFEECPNLLAWYEIVLNDERTQKVLNGKSNFGKLETYFVKVEEDE